jgi:hypothetical protein
VEWPGTVRDIDMSWNPLWILRNSARNHVEQSRTQTHRSQNNGSAINRQTWEWEEDKHQAACQGETPEQDKMVSVKEPGSEKILKGSLPPILSTS